MTAGRKKEFNEDDVLEAAMMIFWQKGYIGTSMSDLIDHMGIKKQSIYRTFGSKEQLFVRAAEVYIKNRAESSFKLLHQEGKSLKERVRDFMLFTLKRQSTSADHKGCFVTLCQSDIDGDMPADVVKYLLQSDKDIDSMWLDLFTNDPDSIRLGFNLQAEQHAMCISTALKGTASMSRINIPYTKLECVVENCIKGIGL